MCWVLLIKKSLSLLSSEVVCETDPTSEPS